MAAKTYDVGDQELETVDRTALLDVVATDIVARRGAASRRRSEKSDQVREMELQLELKKMELEQRRIDAQTEQRRMEIQAEAENRALEVQNEREKREHELRMAEAGRPAKGDERGGYDDQNMDQDGDERVSGTQASTDGDLGRSREAIWFRPKTGSFAYAIKRYQNSSILRKFGGDVPFI